MGWPAINMMLCLQLTRIESPATFSQAAQSGPGDPASPVLDSVGSVVYRGRFSGRSGARRSEKIMAIAEVDIAAPMLRTTQHSAMLSQKPIPRSERLILALDVPSADDARRLVAQLGESVQFYKLGLELFMAGEYYPLLSHLTGLGKKVFVDLKFFDVSETVASAVAQLRGRGATFASVLAGNDAILKAACREKGDTKILAVTVLTHLDQNDMDDLGFKADIEQVVLSRARRALEVGCDGIISSGLEAEQLRDRLGHNFLIVMPGIRPGTNAVDGDDQKRVVNVEEAFMKGADYIVVGRPIRNAADPKKAAQEIQNKIGKLFRE
jgi:orotidine-5'-phosphate decarboxylase